MAQFEEFLHEEQIITYLDTSAILACWYDYKRDKDSISRLNQSTKRLKNESNRIREHPYFVIPEILAELQPGINYQQQNVDICRSIAKKKRRNVRSGGLSSGNLRQLANARKKWSRAYQALIEQFRVDDLTRSSEFDTLLSNSGLEGIASQEEVGLGPVDLRLYATALFRSVSQPVRLVTRDSGFNRMNDRLVGIFQEDFQKYKLQICQPKFLLRPDYSKT